MSDSVPIWMMIAGFLLVLGPLVTLHELGHYLIGRLCGIEAEAFSVGFGRELAGFTDKRGTRWKLSILPLGGYVQFKGDMDPASIPHPENMAQMDKAARAGNFHCASLGQRAATVFAGPAVNFLIAVVIFAGFNLTYGIQQPGDVQQENIVAGFTENSPAKAAGLKIGDKVIAVDSTKMRSFTELQRYVYTRPNQIVRVDAERAGTPVSVELKTMAYSVKDRFGNTSVIGLLGIQARPVEREFAPVGIGAATAKAFGQCYDIIVMMANGLKQIVVGQRSVDELGGPVKIAKYSGEQLSLGPEAFVGFVAMISLNLAFINLLPIPGLDGGHLFFYALEAVRGKAMGAMGTAIAYRSGMAVLVIFMVFVMINDLLTLPFAGN